MEGGLDGADLKGEFPGSVTGEVGFTGALVMKGRERGSWVRAHCIPAFRASRCERKRRGRRNSGGWRDSALRAGHG